MEEVKLVTEIAAGVILGNLVSTAVATWYVASRQAKERNKALGKLEDIAKQFEVFKKSSQPSGEGE